MDHTEGGTAPWYGSILRCPDCLAEAIEVAGRIRFSCGYETATSPRPALQPRTPTRGELRLGRRIPPAPEVLLEKVDLRVPGARYMGPRAQRDSSELLSALLEASEASGDARDRCVLDLGCGPRDQAVCFSHLGFRYVGVDFAGSSADLEADAHFLPFASASFDCVFSYAVLEHLYNPYAALAEVARVLKPGGFYLGTVSQGEPFHGSYFHMTPWGFLSAVAATPELHARRLWGCSEDTLKSLSVMGRYPRAVRLALSALDWVHRAVPLLAPRKMRWPEKERELDRIYRAGSLCFLVARV